MSLLTRSIVRLTTHRFACTVGSNPQGIQDDPSFAGNFIPDFTSPQGFQGELSNGNATDAICQLWLEKCKLYGYDDCNERLQGLLDSHSLKKN